MGGGWVVHKTLTRNEQKVEGEEVQAPVEEEEKINFGGVHNFLPFNFFMNLRVLLKCNLLEQKRIL